MSSTRAPRLAPVPAAQRTILACGGHEFSAAPGNPELGDYLLSLAGRERARICLIPAASGDPDEQITAFRRFFSARGADPAHLSLFGLEQSGPAGLGELLDHDIIYLGGGSLVNLLAILRAHGVDRMLLEAWRRGVVLCGQSAGAMCWFEAGISRSGGCAARVPALEVLRGSLSVHYHRDPDRRRGLLDAVREGAPAGWGVDDGAALLFRGYSIPVALSGRAGAGVWRVEPSAGGVSERELSTERLDARRRRAGTEEQSIAELRAIRASRAGRSSLGRTLG